MGKLRAQQVDLMLCKVRRGVLDKMEAQFATHYNDRVAGRCVGAHLVACRPGHRGKDSRVKVNPRPGLCCRLFGMSCPYVHSERVCVCA